MLQSFLRTILLVVLSAGLMMAGSGCGGDSATPASQLSVEDFRYVQLPDGKRQVMGTLRNEASAPVSAAQVQISLFDANNIRVTSMDVTVQDIPANGTKPFEKPVDVEEDIDGARVRSVLVMR